MSVREPELWIIAGIFGVLLVFLGGMFYFIRQDVIDARHRDVLVAECVKAGRPVLDCKAMVGR